MYKIFIKNINLEISNEFLKNNITVIMKLMIPFTPHLAYECLELLNCKNPDIWPKISTEIMDEIKFAVQIDGKTRDIITVKKNLDKDEISAIILKNSKAKRFIENKKILKTIFVKDKIINYITSL